MSTFEELKQRWQHQGSAAGAPESLTDASLGRMIRSRVRKNTKNSMNYFWASFTLQLMVYALLAHVVIRYGQNAYVLWAGISGTMLFIPFTVLLMHKFKKLATVRPPVQEDAGAPLRDYVLRKQELLRSFYRFKKYYEMILVPVSCAIGVAMVFELYVPGGIDGHRTGFGITFLISLLSCIAAIYQENRKSFIIPITRLQEILDEFDGADSPEIQK